MYNLEKGGAINDYWSKNKRNAAGQKSNARRIGSSHSHYKTTPDYLMGWEESATPFPDDQEEIAKVALFGGDGEVTDEMWNEVKGFVEFIKDKRKRENDNN